MSQCGVFGWGSLDIPALGVLLDASWKTCCQWRRARPHWSDATISLAVRFSPSLSAALLHTPVAELLLFRSGGRICVHVRPQRAVPGCRLRVSTFCFELKHTVSESPDFLTWTSHQLPRQGELFFFPSGSLALCFFIPTCQSKSCLHALNQVALPLRSLVGGTETSQLKTAGYNISQSSLVTTNYTS